MGETVTNEAAERLLLLWAPSWPEGKAAFEKRVNDALAAERRATVERIRERVHSQYGTLPTAKVLDAILDEEAAR